MSEVVSTGQIEIGRVISQLFGVINRNVGPFLGLALLMGGAPQAIAAVLQQQVRAGVGGGIGLVILVSFVSFLINVILAAALIHATTTDLKGERVSIGDSLRFSASNFFGVFAVTLLVTVGIGVGTVLLVVPGLMLATAWSVALPSYLNEGRTQIMDSVGRSAELTRGNRWRIFGLILLGSLVVIALQLVVLVLSGGIGAAIAGRSALVVGLGAAVVNTISVLIWTVGGAALYVELRRAKGGFGADGLAKVFD